MKQFEIEVCDGTHYSGNVTVEIGIAAKFERSIEAAAAYLVRNLDQAQYFVYRGGSHVAVHLAIPGQIQQGTRIALIKEVK